MARIKADKHLEAHGFGFRYVRMIPIDVKHLDLRSRSVQKLDAREKSRARLERDILAARDDAFWSALRDGEAAETAWQRAEAQAKLLQATGLQTMKETAVEGDATPLLLNLVRTWEKATGTKLLDTLDDDAKFEAAQQRLDMAHPVVEAVAKPAKPVAQTLSDALRQHLEDDRLDNPNRSPEQDRKFRERRRRAVERFIAHVGHDPAMEEIGREMALSWQQRWRERIAKERISDDQARKELGVLRSIWTQHFDRLGDRMRQNPFDGLKFKRTEAKQVPPFSTTWIAECFLSGAPWTGLNSEARDIFLVRIETGARASEICNLQPEHIVLDHSVPHIIIAGTKGRQLKTKSSRRQVPLVGAALEAMKRHPNGFSQYRDREDQLSALLGKFMRGHGLRETPAHTANGIRHSYHDRMREAGIDGDLQREITGHAAKDVHAEYGRGHSLEQKAEAMQKIALPFEASIFGS